MTKETQEEKEARELVETIATNIATLSRQVSALLGGRVKTDAVVTLLAYSTKMPRKDIEKVLEALSNLEAMTLKKV